MCVAGSVLTGKIYWIHSDLQRYGEVVLLFFYAKSTLDIKLGSLGCQLCSVAIQLGKICSLLFNDLVLNKNHQKSHTECKVIPRFFISHLRGKISHC